MKHPGPALRRIRESKGISLTTLATTLGRAKQTLSQWELGSVRIPDDVIDGWAASLGYAVSLVIRPAEDGPVLTDEGLTDAQRNLVSVVWRHVRSMPDKDAAILAEVIRMTAERARID